MDALEGKIPLKWMMTGGTPIAGNLHMFSIHLGQNNGSNLAFPDHGRDSESACQRRPGDKRGSLDEKLDSWWDSTMKNEDVPYTMLNMMD